MPELLPPDHAPAAKMGFVAVAINIFGTHLGLLYRLNMAEPIRFLHLAWDHDLKNELFDSAKPEIYFWTRIAIDPLREQHVAQECEDVFVGNPDGIPYGFGEPFGRYDDTGKFIASSGCVGLTCSSFVASVLEGAGVSIIDRNGWGVSCNDAAFFDWVIRMLRGEFPDRPKAKRESHVPAIQAQIAAGAYRYQPMQIAGAATSEIIPVSFQEVVKLAEEVRIKLPQSHRANYF